MPTKMITFKDLMTT